MSVFLAGRPTRALADEQLRAARTQARRGGPTMESAAPAPAPAAATSPDTRAYLAALASMAPAEVIALHMAYVSHLKGKFEEKQKEREAVISKAKKEKNTAVLVDVKDPVGPLEERKLFDASDALALQIVFGGGIAVTIVLYMIGRGRLSWRDLGMSLIPASAYIL